MAGLKPPYRRRSHGVEPVWLKDVEQS